MEKIIMRGKMAVVTMGDIDAMCEKGYAVRVNDGGMITIVKEDDEQ